MKHQTKKKVSKAKLSSTRVIPLSSRRLDETVTSIGFQTAGVLTASKLKAPLEKLKERLGGKGAGLLAMDRLGIPVPPAINLATDLCAVYLNRQTLPEVVVKKVKLSLQGLEKKLGRKFGSSKSPLLVSVRSGARVSMPGMMDTILNLGLNTAITESLAESQPENARFWWDCYRRLIQMFGDVVLGVSDGFENVVAAWKSKESVDQDSKLSVEALQEISKELLDRIHSQGKTFPQDPWVQLLTATEAVFRSWNTERAIHYRKLNQIPDSWGTSVTIQAMVFGNLNDRSGTGVVFTRNPSSGEKHYYGEYLVNAQGEDVVAGIRTPKEIGQLQSDMPKVYKELVKTLERLEKEFRDVQDVEFTVENEKLFVLQTRTAKRTAQAALKHSLQFVKEKKISKEDALKRLSYDHVRQLLHPTLKATNEKPICRGLPASPGAAAGKIAFDPETAVQMARAGASVILVRRETSPEDIMGMAASEGILTATGGMTSHAAVVGRGMGKCCIVGCGELHVDEDAKKAHVGSIELSEGDFITLNGSTGDVYLNALPTEPVTWGKEAQEFFAWADHIAKVPVLANADTPDQAKLAVELGAQGIGLCRTEHMFFEKDRLRKFRLMILSEDPDRVSKYANQLLPYQRDDFIGIFEAMNELTVCVRLLDPPLHEFLPKAHDQREVTELAEELETSESRLVQRIQQLNETNPMLGHRGCRLGITHPQIYEMQVRALAEALTRHFENRGKMELKIMIPLVMNRDELKSLLQSLKTAFEITARTMAPELINQILKSTKWGTMIELPRACLITGQISPFIDFISFGTNDLTQTSMGISRDDGAKFIPTYIEKGLLAEDPFESLDQEGVGRLIGIAVKEGRAAQPKLEVGVCGEHGGDPQSIQYFHRLGFSTISCSPFRVPIARLAAARAKLAKEN